MLLLLHLLPLLLLLLLLLFCFVFEGAAREGAIGRGVRVGAVSRGSFSAAFDGVATARAASATLIRTRSTHSQLHAHERAQHPSLSTETERALGDQVSLLLLLLFFWRFGTVEGLPEGWRARDSGDVYETGRVRDRSSLFLPPPSSPVGRRRRHRWRCSRRPPRNRRRFIHARRTRARVPSTTHAPLLSHSSTVPTGAHVALCRPLNSALEPNNLPRPQKTRKV
jgi:hypothetical protein